MKRLTIFAVALLLGFGILVGGARSAHAAASSTVIGTYTLADNGQGAWGGGALLADGSVTGEIAFSAGNGQLIAKFVPTGWSLSPDGTMVNICFNVVAIKGPVAQELGTSFCGALPVTGTPVKVVEFGGSTTIIRVTIKH